MNKCCVVERDREKRDLSAFATGDEGRSRFIFVRGLVRGGTTAVAVTQQSGEMNASNGV